MHDLRDLEPFQNFVGATVAPFLGKLPHVLLLLYETTGEKDRIKLDVSRGILVRNGGAWYAPSEPDACGRR
jgi:hypothetical protein